ncbi:glycosyltransferase family 9 protein [Fusobacterium ulcerans]|uniref:glycosyltransferase family 9 protein n=1 Tax=Fusobacterium ulcerans TaxID=861 RepID=UPI001D0A2BAE|nr:glycosyltransferase family 9 protein [Fusobacterium ulcerans]MCB8565045.1 glycosyltransferase family 9 protein [Fusobacterium ulcerans]MCB8648958.1 glycosyltransferase family 9 protein [Fusobacterium ulcerans]
MKILIIHSYGMGDMVMSTPMIEKLKNMYNDPLIDFLIPDNQKASKKVIENFSCTNKIMILSNQTGKYRILNKVARLLQITRKSFELKKEKYDLCIMTSGTTGYLYGYLLFLIKAEIKIMEYREENKLLRKINNIIKISTYSTIFSKEIHRVTANLNLLTDLDKKNNSTFKKIETKYYLSEENIDFSNSFFKKYRLENEKVLGVHPGCNSEFKEKRWSKENYLEVINALRKKINIIIFIGPDEKEVGEYLKNRIAKSSKVIFFEENNLSNVAAVISKCTFFFNSDSGLGHIAGCFKLKKTFTIFGPANPKIARVFNKNNVIFYKESTEQNYYLEKDNKGDLKCLSDITSEEVIEVIEKEIRNERGNEFEDSILYK